jgi:Tol biopolymer transport system component
MGRGPLAAGVTRPSGSLAELRFSPSMTRVAFAMRAPPLGWRRLFLTGVAPFAPRPLTDGTTWTGYPAWSPDEQRLAVEVKDGSSTHAAILDVRTGAIKRVTGARGQTWVRSWSPDGRKVAVAALRDGQWSVRWVAADGSGEGEIVPAVAPNVYLRYPDWSARGDVVVFERGELRGNIWALPIS